MKSTETIEFESFIRSDGQLFPIKGFPGPLRDVNYIEGAIRLKVCGKEILSPTMWDCVDQLWAYVITGAERVKQGENYSTFFPDQPIRLLLSPFEGGSRVRIRVEATAAVEATGPTKAFLLAVANGADLFFTELQRLSPGLTSAGKRYRELAKRL